jgi:hypothetical protein
MVLDRRLQVTHAGANTLLDPNKRIVSELDINVTIGAADAAAILGVGYPMGYNESTGDHGPWIAPDPTVSVITLTGATGGTFTITVNDATTSALAWNATAAVVAAALKAIGFVATVALGTLIYTITFDGAAEIKVLPTVSANLVGITGDVTESVTVSDGTAQVASPTVLNLSIGQDVPATGGDYTITYDGNTSAAIAFDDNAAEVKAHILAIGTHAPDNVTVTRIGLGDITVFFDDIADLLSLPTVSGTMTNLTGDTAPGATATVGDVLSLASASEIEIDVSTATGGSFTVTANGLTTAAIAFDATAGEVDTALLAIGFTVVTDLTSEVYTIVFSGRDEVITLPTLSGSIIPLTGDVVAIVTTAGTSTFGTDEIRGFINPEPLQVGTKTGTAALVVLTGTDTLCTATTTNAHGLTTGMSITVSGATESLLNVTATITVLTATTFTYAVSAVSGGTTDSGAYTTTNDTMVLIMSKGTIHATLPESLVATGDVAALRTAMKDGLVEKGLIVQGLAGRF